METFRFIAANLPLIGRMTLEHVSIVGVAVTIAIVTGVPIGILITQNKAAADSVLYVAAIIMTIPSIALFGVLIPVLSLIGQGIGYLPAVIALMLYSQLPIIRNTYTAISNIDPALREAARGMGMSPLERLRRVEIPLALPVIIAGVRIAVVLNIAITAIATYIGAGGLGTFISRGISQTDSASSSPARSPSACSRSSPIMAAVLQQADAVGIRRRAVRVAAGSETAPA